MRLQDVATALNLPMPCADTDCNGVSIDSRAASVGSLFVAIKGDNHDGHQYVPSLAGHCVAAITDRAMETSLPCFQVADTQVALKQLAQYWRDKVTSNVVAITGSCGKTTTRELLRAILAENFSVMASKKSHNNDIGVPLSLLQATLDDDCLVLEAGTNYPGEIERHSRLIRPSIAIILMASMAHTEGLGSLDGVVKEKGDLLLGLQANGVAILNRDDPSFAVWEQRVKPSQRLVSFGLHPDATIRAEAVTVADDGTVSFCLRTAELSLPLHLPMLGRHNVSNALAAIAAALTLGANSDSIQAGLDATAFEPRRLQIKKTARGITLIDDSYNANPKSMQAALQVLADMPGEKKVFVMGAMGELGEQSAQLHREVGEQAKALGISCLHGYGEDAAGAVDAFGEGGYYWSEQAKLIEQLQAELSADTVVLIKGSNAMRMDLIVKALMESTEEK